MRRSGRMSCCQIVAHGRHRLTEAHAREDVGHDLAEHVVLRLYEGRSEASETFPGHKALNRIEAASNDIDAHVKFLAVEEQRIVDVALNKHRLITDMTG